MSEARDENPGLLPLEGGRRFLYLRPQGIRTADLRRILWHLWTVCDDFDPGQEHVLRFASVDLLNFPEAVPKGGAEPRPAGNTEPDPEPQPVIGTGWDKETPF